MVKAVSSVQIFLSIFHFISRFECSLSGNRKVFMFMIFSFSGKVKNCLKPLFLSLQAIRFFKLKPEHTQPTSGKIVVPNALIFENVSFGKTSVQGNDRDLSDKFLCKCCFCIIQLKEPLPPTHLPTPTHHLRTPTHPPLYAPPASPPHPLGAPPNLFGFGSVALDLRFGIYVLEALGLDPGLGELCS